VTDTLPRRAGRDLPPGRAFEIREERDPHVLETELADDRSYAAYALGHLEPGLFEYARYWVARGPAGSAVVMHATAMGNSVVTVGATEAIAALLSLHPGARAAYVSTAAPEHLRALRRKHQVSDVLHMMRMTVTASTFAHAAGGEVRRMRGRDVNRINRLYATDGGPSHYRYDAIERAVYYGAYDGARLVSVAGTHIVAPNQSLGIVGNVFTEPGYRGLGLATRVTSAVTQELFERGCGDVTLTVDPSNTPAVRAYARLGYRRGTPVVEARLARRDLFGVGPALRRAAARRRAGSPGLEIAHAPPDLEEDRA